MFNPFRLLAVAAVLVVPCAAYAQDFPVTIAHAFGETGIPAKPARIVTWGWAVQDAVIALGEVPVGIPHFTYGGDENGALTWTKDAVAALGADFPTILSQSGGVPFEAIAALDPDVVIAPYSGITEEEYARLSQIAPVVAYPETPWTTPWQETIKITGTAMGKADEAAALVAELEQFIRDETAKYPRVEGLTFAGIAEYEGSIAVYSRLDPRMTFLEDAGLKLAPSVDALSDVEQFYYSLSFERAADLTSDIYISYFETPEADAAFFANPGIALTPQVKDGAIAHVIGAEMINSISPPSALSLKWGYPKYIEMIDEAAQAAAK